MSLTKLFLIIRTFTLCGQVLTNIKKTFKSFAYICCFSDGLKDDLSQWRGYADDGKGLCIGFKKDCMLQLKEIILDDDSDLAKFEQNVIFYKEKGKIVDALKVVLEPYIVEYNKNIQSSILSKDDTDDELIKRIYSGTHTSKNFVKNKSFEFEKEYRFCFYDMLHENILGRNNEFLMRKMQAKYRFENGTELSELKYRENRERGILVPYREMKFEKDFFKDMISSVTIGPKNKMSVEEVKFFLLANGFDTSNITIEKSASTYQ